MTTLDKLESHLQSFIEDQLLKILPGRKVEDRLVQQLAGAMHSNLKPQPDGKTLAPNLYVITAHPSTLADWRTQPLFLKALADALQAAGEESGWTFNIKPSLTTAVDTGMAPGETRALAMFSDENVGETKGVPVFSGQDKSPTTVPGNAFLILSGTKIIPLNRSVTNIGRRLENHVVVDDPRVSRNHAQLRVIKNRFFIFDLDSSGGTYVNDQRVNQSILYPGDIISLAGVTIVFGQDIPEAHRPSDETRENPVSEDSAERPTARFSDEEEKTE